MAWGLSPATLSPLYGETLRVRAHERGVQPGSNTGLPKGPPTQTHNTLTRYPDSLPGPPLWLPGPSRESRAQEGVHGH